ncbi:MAG: glutamate racemase [Pseudobdellovibrionaceae bacterium]
MSKQIFDHDPRPIGIFDSGIGGVSVLNSFAERFPNENYIYVGDTARLPYGNKSPETIQKYCDQILNFLMTQNVKLIVVACNTASTQIFKSEFKGIPVIEMISSAMNQLMTKTSAIIPASENIVLLATRSTIQSGVYQKRISEIHPEQKLVTIPCPLFVPLVEEGLMNHTITEQTLKLYFEEQTSLNWQEIHSLILGCTHYPFLKSTLEKYFSKKISQNFRFIDCSLGAVESFAANSEILKNKHASGQTQVFLTDRSDYFDLILKRLGKFKIHQIETIHL